MLIAASAKLLWKQPRTEKTGQATRVDSVPPRRDRLRQDDSNVYSFAKGTRLFPLTIVVEDFYGEEVDGDSCVRHVPDRRCLGGYANRIVEFWQHYRRRRIPLHQFLDLRQEGKPLWRDHGRRRIRRRSRLQTFSQDQRQLPRNHPL